MAARKRDFKLFEENLCKRWKEFSQQIEGLETAEKGMNMLLQNKLREERQEANRIAEEKEKIDRCTVHEKYDELLAKSLRSVTQPLLLPEVFASDTYTDKHIIAMDKNHREQLVEDMKIELDDALYQAKTYRNLAERLQKEKREVCYQMEEKMETGYSILAKYQRRFIKSSKKFCDVLFKRNQLRACVQLICEHNF